MVSVTLDSASLDKSRGTLSTVTLAARKIWLLAGLLVLLLAAAFAGGWYFSAR